MGKLDPIPTLIAEFRGSWGCYSNFYPSTVELFIIDGLPCAVLPPDVLLSMKYEAETYSSVEHAYQASKFLDAKLRQRFQWELTAGQAKRLGANLVKQRRADWFDVNKQIMKGLLIQKFTPTTLRRRLLSSFKALLVEGNDWHDNFWGDCSCPACRDIPGENWLGKLLMEVRSYFFDGGNSTSSIGSLPNPR